MGFIANIWAAKQTSKAQTKASQQSLAEQARQFDLSRSDQMPWLDAGKGALGSMQALNNGDFSKFYQSPDYQFALSEGMKGLDRSAASKGRLYSGGYGEDLTRFGQGLATQNYNNYYGHLADMAGVGNRTATNLGVLGQNYADQYGQNKQNLANARSSAYGSYANAANTGSNLFGSFLGGMS